jgi:hypothetical protein
MWGGMRRKAWWAPVVLALMVTFAGCAGGVSDTNDAGEKAAGSLCATRSAGTYLIHSELQAPNNCNGVNQYDHESRGAEFVDGTTSDGTMCVDQVTNSADHCSTTLTARCAFPDGTSQNIDLSVNWTRDGSSGMGTEASRFTVAGVFCTETLLITYTKVSSSSPSGDFVPTTPPPAPMTDAGVPGTRPLP